jgi:hypothetical protein
MRRQRLANSASDLILPLGPDSKAEQRFIKIKLLVNGAEEPSEGNYLDHALVENLSK